MLLLIISLSLSVLPLATGQCFDQSSSSNSDVACDTGSDPTFCCPASSSCLSIGICSKSGKLALGSCSDPDYSGACSSYCSDAASIASCSPASAGNYCCATGSTKNGQDKCCSTTSNLFHLGDLAAASTLSFSKSTTSTSSTKTTSTSSSRKTTLASTTSSGKSSSKSSSSTGSSSSQSSTASTTTTGTDQVSATTAASDNVTSTSSVTATGTVVPVAAASKGMTTGAKIGAGVGGALGFVALGFSVFLCTFLFRRRNQDKINAARVAGLRAKAEANSSRSFSNNSGYSAVNDASELRALTSPSLPPPVAAVHRKPVPSQQQERVSTIPDSERVLSTNPSSFNLPIQGQPVTPQRQVYRAYQPPPSQSRLDVNELGFPEVPSSAPSFSELVTPTSPHAPPFRAMTPAEELAAARLRTNNRDPTPPNNRELPPNPPTGRGTTEAVRRADSVVSDISGPSARDRDRERAALSRGNSVVSGQTEFNRTTRYEM